MEPQNTNQNIPSQPVSPQQMPQTNGPLPSAQPTPLKESHELTGNAEKLKKLSIQVMIGGLIGAAILAVVAVLANSFNDTFGKALFTLFLVMVHALACLAYVEQTGKSKNSSFKFFENSVFLIIVLSFFTSIFGVWGLLAGSIVGKLYGSYFVLVFACLHGQMLVETREKQKSIDTIVNVNYLMMSLVIALILPIIWLTDTDFPNFYYRILAACGIVDGTLTILAVILHRLYVQKHPEAQSVIFSVATKVDAQGNLVPVQAAAQKRHIHPLVWVLGLFMLGQFVISLLFAALGAFYR